MHLGRWGSIAHCVTRLRGLVEQALRKAWHADLFGFRAIRDRGRDGHESIDPAAGGEDPEAPKRLDAKSLEVLNDAITSQWFWSYAGMLAIVAETLTDLMAWSESCPCHHKATSSVRQLLPKGRCPMAGKRAPELAAGDLDEYISSLLAARAGQVLISCGAPLKKKEQKKLLQEYSACRHHVTFVLSLKLRPWQLPPLVFAGLCHPCKCTAARVAGKILKELQQDQSLFELHPLGLALIESPVLLGQLQLLAENRAQLHELPALRACVGPLGLCSHCRAHCRGCACLHEKGADQKQKLWFGACGLELPAAGYVASSGHRTPYSQVVGLFGREVADTS